MAQQPQGAEVPLRWPLVIEPQNRDETSSKDAQLINCYMELQQTPQGREYWLYKRPGILQQSRPPAADAAGSGVYNWCGDVYSVFGATLYKNGVAVAGTVNSAGGVYAFSSCLGAVPKMQLGNGIKAYNYDDTNGLVEVLTVVALTAGSFVTGIVYTIVTVGSTNFTLIGAASNTVGVEFTATGAGAGTGTASGPAVITAGAFVVGQIYTILTVGTTDYTLIGASANTIGVEFLATGVGSGTGTAWRSGAFFPTAFVKGWAYLDGTTYVMKANAHILGSEINDPVNWDPLNDILAQIEPDQGVALAKQLVYVIALKQWTTEAFYDAGNATGSPLAPVQGAKVNYGCVSSGSVQDIDGALIWVCISRTAGTQVIILDQLKADIISTKPVERLLQTADWTTTYSWQISLNGHRFYVITSKLSNLTLAFDLDERMWHRWTDSSGNYMPIVASTFDSSLRAIVQHETNGRLYYASPNYLNDDGVVIISDIYTPNFDGGVQSRTKTLYREFFVGDQVNGSQLEVRVSDDDYQTWSPPRLVDLSKKRPYLDNCGTFFRRAQWIRHRSNTRMRLKAIELQMELGSG